MNNYEASEVFKLGNAHELILGQKEQVITGDSELGPEYRTLPNDIDESDE